MNEIGRSCSFVFGMRRDTHTKLSHTKLFGLFAALTAQVTMMTLSAPSWAQSEASHQLEFDILKAATEQELQDSLSKVPLELAQLLRPIPPEKNAAQLYFQAFAELSNDMKWATDDFEMFDSLYPNSKSARIEIKDLFEKLENAKHVTEVLPELTKKIPNWKSGLEKIKIAQQREACYFDTGDSICDVFRHLNPAKLAACALTLRIVYKTQTKRIDDAIEDLRMLLRLSSDVRNRQGFIHGLISISMEQMAIDHAIPSILFSQRTTASQFKRVISAVHTHLENLPPGWTNFQRQAIQGPIFYHQMEHRTGAFSSEIIQLCCQTTDLPPIRGSMLVNAAVELNEQKLATDSDRRFAKKLDRIVNSFSSDDYKRFQRDCTLFYEEIKKLDHAHPRLLSEAADDFYQKRKKSNPLFFYVQCPPIIISADKVRRNRMKIIMCYAAVELWKLEKKELPANLKSVCKFAGMDEVPTDEFSNQTVKWLVSKDKVLIYTIGPGKKDHRGKLLWNYDRSDWKGNLFLDWKGTRFLDFKKYRPK